MIFHFFGVSYNNFAAMHGVTHYTLIGTIIATLFHYTLTYILCHIYNLKMLGVAISTSLHFVCRFVVPYILVTTNSFFEESLIPFSSKESRTDLCDIIKIGFQTIQLRVMGWWAFDVFTLMASQLSPTDIAA